MWLAVANGSPALFDSRNFVCATRLAQAYQMPAGAENWGASAVVHPQMVVIPFAVLPLRVAKYNVHLREDSLWAVKAMHEILGNMVMFTCKVCNELFPTFHPAFEPPSELAMQLLKTGHKGVASCDVMVATWDEFPVVPKEYAESPPRADRDNSPTERDTSRVAARHTGRCRRCQQDIEEQQAKGRVVVPKYSHLNWMDPCWKFPYEELADLFRMCTVTESMLLALEHMQVSFVTIRRTRLSKFHKNVISFPQQTARFFAQLGALKQYRIGDRVNSNRGPCKDGEDQDRDVKKVATASTEERELYAADESGHLVFPATVKHVKTDGHLVLDYMDKNGEVVGRGAELPEWVTPACRCPGIPAT